MENKRQQNLESLKSVIDKLAKNLGVEKGLKEIALINMWPEIVGPRFKDKSKAVSVIKKGNYDILLVAVASSVISQELFLFKKDIVRKLSPLTKPLGFNIRDLYYNTKIWVDNPHPKVNDLNDSDKSVHFFIKNPTDNELKDISIPENLIDMVKESISSQNFSSDELKDRIMATIIRDIKVQIWRKTNGFPCCSQCGIPVNYYNPDKEALCPSCKYLN